MHILHLSMLSGQRLKKRKRKKGLPKACMIDMYVLLFLALTVNSCYEISSVYLDDSLHVWLVAHFRIKLCKSSSSSSSVFNKVPIERGINVLKTTEGNFILPFLFEWQYDAMRLCQVHSSKTADLDKLKCILWVAMHYSWLSKARSWAVIIVPGGKIIFRCSDWHACCEDLLAVCSHGSFV